MKKLKFLLTALWIACFPVYFSSCEPSNPDDFETPEKPEEPNTPDTPENPETPDTPENPETTIIGSWKLTKAIRQNSEGAIENLVSLEGQLWTFDALEKLIVDNQEFAYSISGTQLNTQYAATYATTFFSIQEITAKSLTLYASHEERDKVGKRLIFYTFVFERVD
jgi:hypothetical protein